MAYGKSGKYGFFSLYAGPGMRNEKALYFLFGRAERERLIKGLVHVETLTPEDIQTATAYVKEQGLAVRLQKFAGQSGDIFYLDDLDRKTIIRMAVETLSNNAMALDAEGHPRISLITTGIFITKDKLHELLPFKDYLMVDFNVDPAHHNASGLCHEKISSLAGLFGEDHRENCVYLNCLRERSKLVKSVLGKEKFWIVSVVEQEETELKITKPIAEFFEIEGKQVFDGTACVPHKETWFSRSQARSRNTDLMFIDKVKGNLRLYPSFPDLLLGNPSAILTP